MTAYAALFSTIRYASRILATFLIVLSGTLALAGTIAFPLPRIVVLAVLRLTFMASVTFGPSAWRYLQPSFRLRILKSYSSNQEE